MKDQFAENVHRRFKRLPDSALVDNPHAALWLLAAEERRTHPLLYAKHRAIEFLRRFRG